MTIKEVKSRRTKTARDIESGWEGRPVSPGEPISDGGISYKSVATYVCKQVPRIHLLLVLNAHDIPS